MKSLPIAPPESWARLEKEAWIALFSLVAILLYLVLRYGLAVAQAKAEWLLLAALVLGAIPLLMDLGRKAWKWEFGSDLLAGISIVTAALLGEYLVAVIVVLMLSGGSTLERLASRRAVSALDALARRMPSIAHRREAGGMVDVAVDEISPGDQLVLFPHEVCPADGVVIAGDGSMDEAYLTGEPFQIAKAPGARVVSGAINGESVLTIRAERRAVDSRYARILRVVEMSEQSRPQARRVGDRIGAWYTPFAVLVALVSALAGGGAERFLAVVVVATPCPLLLGIPVAIVGAISLAAKRGIVIRRPDALERIDTCSILILDKTGTLTYGTPALTEILAAPGFDNHEILAAAADLERYSKHPLAAAILAAADAAGIAPRAIEKMSEKPGEGLRGWIGGREIWITGRSKLPHAPPDLPPPAAGLEALILIDGRYAGCFRFHDKPRPESRSFVGHLTPRHGIQRIVLLSGDRESEVRYLAETVGIEEVYFNQVPEQKVEFVRASVRQGGTIFVGDGINDAPALLAATVGIAFGTQSDITADAADAVVMDASLVKVDELLHLARHMRRILLQSAMGGMGLSLIGMGFAAAGLLTPVAGAIAQEGIDLLAVLNASRTAIRPQLTDF